MNKRGLWTEKYRWDLSYRDSNQFPVGDMNDMFSPNSPQDCALLSTATQPCNDIENCDDPWKCIVSPWSNYGPCKEGAQARTREILKESKFGGAVCPSLKETRYC